MLRRLSVGLLATAAFVAPLAASESRSISDSNASKTRATALEAASHEGLQGAAEV